jgi:hypothetical protein
MGAVAGEERLLRPASLAGLYLGMLLVLIAVTCEYSYCVLVL